MYYPNVFMDPQDQFLLIDINFNHDEQDPNPIHEVVEISIIVYKLSVQQQLASMYSIIRPTRDPINHQEDKNKLTPQCFKDQPTLREFFDKFLHDFGPILYPQKPVRKILFMSSIYKHRYFIRELEYIGIDLKECFNLYSIGFDNLYQYQSVNRDMTLETAMRTVIGQIQNKRGKLVKISPKYQTTLLQELLVWICQYQGSLVVGNLQSIQNVTLSFSRQKTFQIIQQVQVQQQYWQQYQAAYQLGYQMYPLIPNTYQQYETCETFDVSSDTTHNESKIIPDELNNPDYHNEEDLIPQDTKNEEEKTQVEEVAQQISPSSQEQPKKHQITFTMFRRRNRLVLKAKRINYQVQRTNLNLKSGLPNVKESSDEDDGDDISKIKEKKTETSKPYQYLLIIDAFQPDDKKNDLPYNLIQFNAIIYSVDQMKPIKSFNRLLDNQNIPEYMIKRYNLDVIFEDQKATRYPFQTILKQLQKVLEQLKIETNQICPVTYKKAIFNKNIINFAKQQNIILPDYLQQPIYLKPIFQDIYGEASYDGLVSRFSEKNINIYDSYETTRFNLELVIHLQTQQNITWTQRQRG